MMTPHLPFRPVDGNRITPMALVLVSTEIVTRGEIEAAKIDDLGGPEKVIHGCIELAITLTTTYWGYDRAIITRSPEEGNRPLSRSEQMMVELFDLIGVQVARAGATEAGVRRIAQILSHPAHHGDLLGGAADLLIRMATRAPRHSAVEVPDDLGELP